MRDNLNYETSTICNSYSKASNYTDVVIQNTANDNDDQQTFLTQDYTVEVND